MLEATSIHDSMSLEELSFEMELLDYSLEGYYAELAALHDSIIVSSAEVSLEDVVGANLGSLSGRGWDDLITKYKRFFSGILDAVRSKESATKAYRNKLAESEQKVMEYLSKNSSQNHSASFITMEKYWLYPNGKYPNKILPAVSDDLKYSQELLTQGPLKAIKASEEVNKIVESTVFTSEETVHKSMFLKMKNIDTVESIVGPKIYNNRDLFLYQTVVTSKLPKREKKDDETLFTTLNVRNPLVIKNGGAAHDVKNAALSFVAGHVGNSDRIVNTPGFTLSTKELSTLLEYGNTYLDSAESYLARVQRQLGAVQSSINHLFQYKLPNSDKKPDKASVKKVFDLAFTYHLNLMGFVDKPMHDFVNRQIKMSKGIHYLVVRTIGRKA